MSSLNKLSFEVRTKAILKQKLWNSAQMFCTLIVDVKKNRLLRNIFRLSTCIAALLRNEVGHLYGNGSLLS